MEHAPLIGTLNVHVSLQAPPLSPLASALAGALLREKGRTSTESQKSRASAPTSMWKNEQLPTTPTPALAPGRWIDERYEL